jgi:hypothetical protein
MGGKNSQKKSTKEQGSRKDQGGSKKGSDSE